MEFKMVHNNSSPAIKVISRKTSSTPMENSANLRRKRLADHRSVTVDASQCDHFQQFRKRHDSTSEIKSISSIFSNDFVRLGNQRYGKLLSRENTVDSATTENSASVGNCHRLTSFFRAESPVSASLASLDRSNCSKYNQKNHLHPDKLKAKISTLKLSEEQGTEAEKTLLSQKPSPYAVKLLIENNEAKTKPRIIKRRILFNRRKKVCDISVILALIGILVMMLDLEVGGVHHLNKRPAWVDGVSWFFKFLEVATTIGLLVSILAYQAVEIEIFLMESGAEDWRVAISAKRITLAILEILICMICPLPGLDHMVLSYQDPLSRSTPTCGINIDHISIVPLNVLLSIPMFARSYLMCRAMVLHSKQFQDTSIWSIASFNHVTVNFKFVTKTLLSDHPLMVLGMFTISTCCCAAWMFTQCERRNQSCGQDQCHSYLDSLWLVIVTLLAIGYGDVVPHTYCGRFVAILAGMSGMAVSAAVISVMSTKIGLTRQEKQVNNFVADSKLASGIRNAAASVLQETWLIHKHKRIYSVSSKFQVIRHQRKFLQAINRFRCVKLAQRSLWDRQFEFVDIRKTQHEVQETVLEMQQEQAELLLNFQLLMGNAKEANSALKSELKRTIRSLEHNQEILMTDMCVVQRSLGDIQIQLSAMANQLSQMQRNTTSPTVERKKCSKAPALQFIPSGSSSNTTVGDECAFEEV